MGRGNSDGLEVDLGDLRDGEGLVTERSAMVFSICRNGASASLKHLTTEVNSRRFIESLVGFCIGDVRVVEGAAVVVVVENSLGSIFRFNHRFLAMVESSKSRQYMKNWCFAEGNRLSRMHLTSDS